MYEKYSILFVDDEVNILSSLRRGLLEEEYTCHFAESAIRALELLEQRKIDVLVTDMRMPEMNGLELLKQVEANYPSIVKLVLSGYAQIPQILATINQVSIFNFILKPWSIDELILILHKALDYYILQEENASYKAQLEIKNQSYQNILKRIDDVIDDARKSADMLRIISDQILYLGRDIKPEERYKFYGIFAKKYDIYEVLSKAVTLEQKAMSSSILQLQLIEQIQQLFPDAIVDSKPVFESTVILNKQMLEAFLSAICILFNEEFTEHGLYIGFSYGSRFHFSIISQNAAEAANRTSRKVIFDAKMAFIRSLVEKLRDLCHITLQIINKDGNLVIGFSFEDQ